MMSIYKTVLTLIFLFNLCTGGVDYYSGEFESIVFFAGKESACFDVPIINDAIVEGNESFSINIMPTMLPCNVKIGNINQITVNIIDGKCM